MSPLTTPYLGRVARGDMTAVRASSPAPRTNGLCEEGPNASRRGPMPLSLSDGHFHTLSMSFAVVLISENAPGAPAATLVSAPFETGRA